MQSNATSTPEEIQLMNKLFNDAEELLKSGNDAKAEIRYSTILECDPEHVCCLFRLGEIHNRRMNPMKAFEYHTNAVGADSHLAEKLTPKDHVSHNYVYQPMEETTVEACPLCGAPGAPHSCYNDLTSIDFIPGFNPIRMWMHCKICDHIYARNYPHDLGRVLSNSSGSFHMKPNVHLLPVVSEIVNRIGGFTSGNRLLDIGVGAGEFAAAAKEFGFDIRGVEIRKAYADQVSKTLDIDVHNTDFMAFDPQEKFDAVSMGDVIEHLTDPVAAMKKVNSLLNENGVLWISTPNFNSAYSSIMKDADPMWRVCEHLNYFSFDSMKKLLESTGFEVMDYNSSKHYNGSMEIISRKITDISAMTGPHGVAAATGGIRRLNLGCGADIRKGWINLDIARLDGVDVAADLDNCRRSPLPFEDDWFGEIYAGHVLEYIHNPLPLMQELHRICKPDAKAVFKVFYGSSDEATEDPGYARQYYQMSFGYFSQPFYWRADYGYRGDWLTEKITLFVEGAKYKGMNQSLILEDVYRKRNVVREMVVEMKAVKPIREAKKELQAQVQIEIAFV